MWIACLFSFLLITVTVIFHYEIFRIISGFISGSRIPSRLRILIVIFGITAAHVIEIIIYSVAYFFLDGRFGLGGFSEKFEPSFLNYFYFSAVSYTTLGLSSFYPIGAIKIISSLEALNGFILITWSASFAYVATGKFWKSNGD